jgi:O-antigen ligase
MHAGVTLLLSSLFAVDVALRYSMKKQLQLLAMVLMLEMLLSVFIELIVPGLVPSGDTAGSAAWHGVFPFKNAFGRMICFAVVAGLALLPPKMWLRLATIASGIALAVLSRSASALGYVLILTLLFSMLPILKWRPKPRKVTLFGVALISCASIYYVSQHLEQVTAVMDKDPHLTGRVDLWQLSLASIAERPLLGYGYEAFWNADSQPARRIREETRWEGAPHAHNGYIDLALSLGSVGVIGYVLFYWKAVRRAFVFFMDGREGYRRWPLCFLAFVLMYQFTESGIFSPNNILWIIFCSITFSLTRLEEVSQSEEIAQLSRQAA